MRIIRSLRLKWPKRNDEKPTHPFTNDDGDPMSFRHVRENITAIKINYYYCRSNVYWT